VPNPARQSELFLLGLAGLFQIFPVESEDFATLQPAGNEFRV
jgi:hypothetical protein